MKFKLDDKFEWFLDKDNFGKPNLDKKVTPQILTKYRNKLPDRLLEYWEEYGFCSFKDGLFSIVNPNDYQDIMEVWLNGSGIMEEDNFYVIAKTGFGDLLLWGENTDDKYTIEARDGVIYQEHKKIKPIAKEKMTRAIQDFFAVRSTITTDLKDVDTDKFIFASAVEKFGALAPDEMFTLLDSTYKCNFSSSA